MQRSIGCTALNGAFALGDVLSYAGGYTMTGAVIGLHGPYGLLLSPYGHLARVTFGDDIDFRVKLGVFGRVPADQALAVRRACKTIVDRPGAERAIRLAIATDPDPADHDKWMIPITYMVGQARLTPMAERYLGWPAHTRRRFEACVDLLSGERQREVFLANVMGNTPISEIRDRHGLQKSAARMARWRAIQHLTSHMGYALDGVTYVRPCDGRSLTASRSIPAP